jgi:uncharacterized protein (TIGR03083 family)
MALDVREDPIHTNHLFRPLAGKLIALLRWLPPDSWDRPTCYPNWTVHDIAAHLLQTGVSRLSRQRDGYPPPESVPNRHFSNGPSRGTTPSGGAGARHREPNGFDSISNHIDRSNTEWTNLLAGVSPAVITELLTVSEMALARFLAGLAKEGEAPIPVAWAGESESQIWFDTAREFTERWHHQQQIREAVGAPPLTQPRFLRPVLRTLIRGVPFWYRDIPASTGETVLIKITGASGGSWTLCRDQENWCLRDGEPDERCQTDARDAGEPTAARTSADATTPGATTAAATVSMSEDTAWRFLTRTISAEIAEPRIDFGGNDELSRPFLKVLAIMVPEHLR